MVIFLLGLLSMLISSLPHAILVDTLGRALPLLLGAVILAFLSRAMALSIVAAPAPISASSAPCATADPRGHHEHMARVHLAAHAKSPLQLALDSPFMQAGVLLLIFSDVATTLCELMLSEVCPAPAHGSHDAHSLEHWEVRLAWTGRAMLGVLMVHQLLLLWAYGWEFWHHKMHVLDFVICCVAVGLEAVELLRGEGTQQRTHEGNKDEALCVPLPPFSPRAGRRRRSRAPATPHPAA